VPGRFLFRWRGVIGVLAFGVVFWLARPTFGSCLLGLPFILAGLATRFWASGYIGIEGRVREIGASRRIASGPYRLLRHPLYIGNFLLVGFVAEYGLIVAAEERDLGQKWSSGQAVKCSVLSPGSLVQSPESMGEKQGTVPGSRTGPCEGTVPVFRHGQESFEMGRAMCEWRTWVVTGVAWGLAVVKALM